MIDTNKPIRFFDDTAFNIDEMFSINILFNGKKVCVCMTNTGEEIVFEKEEGRVLNDDYNWWYAQNDDYRSDF